MTKPKIGFLFDVDGTLTYYRGNDSIVDLLIINDLEAIRKRKHPLGLVTGRSVNWVRQIFFEHINESLKEYIQIFGEFGLVVWHNGKKRKGRINSDTKNALAEIKKKIIDEICFDRDLETVVSYQAPQKRALWIEPKEIMLTFRTMPTFGLTIEVYQNLIEPIIADYSDLLRLEANPYSADILPISASKKKGAETAIKKLDPDKIVKKWYAFGDSKSDKKMEEAKGSTIDFYLIPRGDTSKAHYIIQNLLIGKE